MPRGDSEPVDEAGCRLEDGLVLTCLGVQKGLQPLPPLVSEVNRIEGPSFTQTLVAMQVTAIHRIQQVAQLITVWPILVRYELQTQWVRRGERTHGALKEPG